jgi:hypothetical protein
MHDSVEIYHTITNLASLENLPNTVQINEKLLD